MAVLKEALRNRLTSPRPYPGGRFDGRGIVICAGGLRYFTCAWVLITLLRRVYDTKLPIQVWHLGRGELSEEMQLVLDSLQVETVDAETVVGQFPARIAGGWPLKPYAIQHSRFREVLYLDADTVPFQTPEGLFEWDLYRQSGVLMWPDIVDLTGESPIWRDLGLEPRDCTSIEAGILLVDKARAWPMLDLAVLINEHVEEVYSAVYGDKDTFLMATLLLGLNPTLVPHRPFVFDLDLVQRDPAGNPLLQHRTGSKWQLTGRNRVLAARHLMGHCEQALADLRQAWSGEVFNAPARSQTARAEESHLLQVRQFYYEPRGSEPRQIELLPAGRVGEGNGFLERHWAVVERDSSLVLQFFSSTRLTVELLRCSDGSWDGQGTGGLDFSARLTELVAHQTWPHAETRVCKSASELINALVDISILGVGFDQTREQELHAALSLLNDLFDDVPEQLDAVVVRIALSTSWRDSLLKLTQKLAAHRDSRLRLTARSNYPKALDQSYYERVP